MGHVGTWDFAKTWKNLNYNILWNQKYVKLKFLVKILQKKVVTIQL